MSAIEATAGLNNDEWERLCDSLKSNVSLSKAVAFVGAGLSRPDLPGWRGLLNALQNDMRAKNVDAAEEMRALSSKKKFLEAAEIYETKAGLYDLDIVLRREFSPDRYLNIPDERHELLVRIPWRAILTTNLDTVLETPRLAECGWNLLVGGRQVTSTFWKDVIICRDRYLLKLHGTLNAESAVLSKTAFKDLMESAHYREFLRDIFTRYHVVFMGYSVTDPEVLKVLSRLRKLFRGHLQPSTMLTPSATEKQVGDMRKRYNVRVAQYGESQEHKGLTIFLQRLFDALHSRHSTLPTSLSTQLAEFVRDQVPDLVSSPTALPRLSVLDGVQWNRLDELLRLRDEKPDLIKRSESSYFATLQAVVQSVVCADAVGFYEQMHGMSNDHTIHELTRVVGGPVVVPMRSIAEPLITFVSAPWVRKVLRKRLGDLSATAQMKALYEPLVLRDAEQYFGDHSSLEEPEGPDSAYVFGKEYIVDDDLSAAVPDSFAELWLEPLNRVTVGRGSSKSCRAFVRRLMVTHFAIGLQYGCGLQPSSSLVVPEIIEVMQTPTRMGAEPAQLDEMGAEIGMELGRHAIPVLVTRVLTVARCESSKVLHAMAEERDKPFARLVRDFLAEIAHCTRQHRSQDVRKLADNLRQYIAAEETVEAIQSTRLAVLGPQFRSFERVVGDPSRFAVPSVKELARVLWRRTFYRR